MADLSHIEGKCKVTSLALTVNQDKAIEKAGDVLQGCDLVLVPAGVPRKPGQDRKDLLDINCNIAKGTVEACAKHCPNAVLGLIVNPVNSVVPAMCEMWKKAGLDPRKIVGISTLDIVRANKFVSEKTGKPACVPVIGGHAGKTILPLFSQDAAAATIDSAEIPALDSRVQDAGTEVVKAKNGKGSATLSMAYSGARLGKAVLSGLAGVPATECAYVESNFCEGLQYFASPVVFGCEGVEAILPPPTLSAHEQARLEELYPILSDEILDGLEYADSNQFSFGSDYPLNSAFVFVKPHAVTPAAVDLVRNGLVQAGLRITSEGVLTSEEIDQNKLIDQHYYAIASKATILKPSELNVPKDKFRDFFGIDYDDALARGIVVNAMDACQEFGVDAEALADGWGQAKKAGKLIKFGGGFYCGLMEMSGKQLYVFNAFFMSMRAGFTAPGKCIHYFTVEWDPAALSWADFRGQLLGPTDPADAPPGSLRGLMLAHWEQLGLPGKPNTGDNGVHASASPFEGLAERVNWLGLQCS